LLLPKEVFNQRKVELVDINEAPIERVTARGIKPAGRTTSSTVCTGWL
jgi:hypothetical protein